MKRDSTHISNRYLEKLELVKILKSVPQPAYIDEWPASSSNSNRSTVATQLPAMAIAGSITKHIIIRAMNFSLFEAGSISATARWRLLLALAQIREAKKQLTTQNPMVQYIIAISMAPRLGDSSGESGEKLEKS
jgi:hypothetical protein